MTVDVAAFRAAAALYPTGVTIVTVRAGDDQRGMTVNSFTTVSLDPLLVLFCVSRRAHLATLLSDVTGFAINVLRHDQEALSTYFAGGWSGPPPPFRLLPWNDGSRLEGSALSLGCNLHGLIDGGDHWIVLGHVVALHMGCQPVDPLIFFRGRYAQLERTRSAPAPDLSEVVDPVRVFYEPWDDPHGRGT